MSLFNKSKVQSLFISFILSLLTIITLLLYNSFSHENVNHLLFLVIPLFLISFLFVFIYFEFFIFKKIKNLYRDLIPKENIENSLVNTNMDTLINDLKRFKELIPKY